MPAFLLHREQGALPQLREVQARRRRRESRRTRESARRQRAAVEEREEDRGASGLTYQRCDIGDRVPGGHEHECSSRSDPTFPSAQKHPTRPGRYRFLVTITGFIRSGNTWRPGYHRATRKESLVDIVTTR